ncbi:MAG: DUF72 domain-containing protein [Candidatus Eremiobacteraeota bacterium]|nr:DUF72 domain-containing protein [Candidatus Eremiobacteraeota bacterium]
MIRIGTSGWVYRDWRGRFYPAEVPQRRWLAYYADRFDTVELNATTYRLPKPEQVQTWCDAVPAGFRYTVKLSRLITHRRAATDRLDTFIANYFERAACFVPEKLAQILVQFPPFLERDDARLRDFIERLPAGYRYVVEFRHASWFETEVRRLLEQLGIAFCIHDYPGLRVPEWITSPSLAYVRFHGATALYAGSYPAAALKRWGKRLQTYEGEAADVYAYFNNDVLAAAPHDALALRAKLPNRGGIVS